MDINTAQATLRNTRTGGYYADLTADEAEVMAAEWNDGLGRNDWRVEYRYPDTPADLHWHSDCQYCTPRRHCKRAYAEHSRP